MRANQPWLRSPSRSSTAIPRPSRAHTSCSTLVTRGSVSQEAGIAEHEAPHRRKVKRSWNACLTLAKEAQEHHEWQHRRANVFDSSNKEAAG